jgi:hypothetical protein
MSVHREIAADLHTRLVALAAAPARGGISPSPEALLEEVLRRDAPLLPPEDRDEVRRLLLERTVGLGPLESLLDDDEIYKAQLMISVTSRGVMPIIGGRERDGPRVYWCDPAQPQRRCEYVGLSGSLVDPWVQA